MNLLCKRIITGICAISITFSCVVLAFAASPSVSSEITGFWESLVNSFNQSVTGSGPLSFLAKYAISSLASDVCAQSEDGHHHGNLTGKTYHLATVEYEAKCTACGQLFRVTDDTVSSAYNDYISALPTPGVSSAGNLLWQPEWKDATVLNLYYDYSKTIDLAKEEFPATDFKKVIFSGNQLIYDWPYQTPATVTFGVTCRWVVPVTGYYSRLWTVSESGFYIPYSGVSENLEEHYSTASFNGSAGDTCYISIARSRAMLATPRMGEGRVSRLAVPRKATRGKKFRLSEIFYRP